MVIEIELEPSNVEMEVLKSGCVEALTYQYTKIILFGRMILFNKEE